MCDQVNNTDPEVTLKRDWDNETNYVEGLIQPINVQEHEWENCLNLK